MTNQAQACAEAWGALAAAAQAAGGAREHFAAEPERLSTLSFEAGGLFADLSKQDFSLGAWGQLLALARACGLEARRAALFAGEAVNVTEARPALHMALRGTSTSASANAEAGQARAATRAFAEAVRSGARRGSTGRLLRHIVHIGIGGSDFGPRFLAEALLDRRDPGFALRFAANVDGAEIADALDGLDPEATLLIVASKSFSTQETRLNAEAALYWLHQTLGAERARSHLVAVTARPARAAAFGVGEDGVFAFPDWVGGRFSVWSPVGLCLDLAYGPDVFDAILAGGAAMDAHFRDAPLARNLPVALALTDVWNRSLKGRPGRVIAPYSRRLRLLPQLAQQTEMESNGKGVTLAGAAVSHPTAPLVFGSEGTNAQHAYFQQLHQGRDETAVEFVGVLEDAAARPAQHRALLANMIAQGEALMNGAPPGTEPHRACPGGRPSTTLLLARLAPEPLGALLALYEHKTFAASVIWGINAFDQWGVELGKTLAAVVLGALEGGPAGGHDPSTAGLIARVRRGLE